MSNELKPCPSCGGADITEDIHCYEGKAICRDCQFSGPHVDQKEIAASWNALTRKITLTKTLPSEPGRYYWAEGSGLEVDIYDLFLTAGSLFVDRGDFGNFRVALMGGYWAKVEQDHFEFEGE